MTTGEQRQHPRYAIELDAELHLARNERVVGRTVDLSRGGFCVHVPRPLTVGAECRVRIALVFSATEFSESLELPATIVWCTRLKGYHQVGVKFSPVEPQLIGYLDMFIKFLEPPADEGAETDEPGGEE